MQVVVFLLRSRTLSYMSVPKAFISGVYCLECAKLKMIYADLDNEQFFSWKIDCLCFAVFYYSIYTGPKRFPCAVSFSYVHYLKQLIPVLRIVQRA